MQVCLEYVWIGGNNEFRNKTKVHLFNNIKDIIIENIPEWNFDGSSTQQAEGMDSEVIIKPVCLFNDPYRRNGKLVLCETYNVDGTPHVSNTRYHAKEIFDKYTDEHPWYGLEQEYFIYNKDTNLPLGFEKDKNMNPQGQYYCSVGSLNCFGRNIVEEHLQVCLLAGIKISGINAEVAPGQWEFQVGPCEGIEEGDHLCMARYLLQRVSEKFNVYIDLEPKPIKGDWNGSGCHTNFSTQNMREGNEEHNGLYYIDEAIKKLSLKHKEHMEVYGKNNDQRMSGKLETSSYDIFSDGIANRGCSIRRGNNTVKECKGYFEDRRPASNCDPYLVTSKILDTIMN